MPISYRIDVQQRCIYYEFAGGLNQWDVGVTVQAAWTDPLYDPSFDRLVDTTALEARPLSPTFLSAIAADRTARRSGKVAFVGKQDKIERFEKHFAPNANGSECAAFPTREEALAWLGIPR